MENGHRNDVDFPSLKMVTFYSYVKLPEGSCNLLWLSDWSLGTLDETLFESLVNAPLATRS